MKLLVSTPCSGGMLHQEYCGSLLSAISRARAEGLCDHIEVHFQGKESLIHRARDFAAIYALEGGFDRLLTIDADVSFTYEDFARVVSAKEPIVGGAYPLKCFPVVMNVIPLPDRGQEFFSSNRGLDLDAWTKFVHKYADPDSGLVEVSRIATGFLSVSVEVLAKLSHSVEVYRIFQMDTGAQKGFFHFYPSDVRDSSLRSEDWGFCDLAREAGYSIFLDTRVTLGHTGSHCFRLGQFYGTTNA